MKCLAEILLLGIAWTVILSIAFLVLITVRPESWDLVWFLLLTPP